MTRAGLVALLVAACVAGCAAEDAAPSVRGAARSTDTPPTSSEGVATAPVVTAPLSDLLWHIPASADPVTARVRSLRSIGTAAGLSVPELDGPRDDWYTWSKAVGCCRGLDPVIPAPHEPAELAEASGWSVRDIEAVASANVGGAPMPVVVRGEFRTAEIQSRLGGRPGQVITLGTPGKFDLGARSPVRPQGQSVSFLYDEALVIGGYEPAEVEAAASPVAPLAERDDIVESLGVLDDVVDDLIIQTGGSYFVANEFLLCLPRCQDSFDLIVELGLPVSFSSVVIGYDHDAQRATLVWVHADAVAAEQNAPQVTELLEHGYLDAAGVLYESLIVDPVVEVRGRLLVVTATASPRGLAALVREAEEFDGIFGHRVLEPGAG